jgi:alpha-glucosidase
VPAPESAPWWQRGVVYQIYPRSFADSTGDGVGDLPGITEGLDHLRDLGVDALWLSPFFRSPMADFGYDVADFCDVDPLFGTLEDFDAMLAAAHERDLKVVIDWVPNHTSDQHPWFVESRSSPTSAKRDWYVWRDPAPDGGPPNNWRAAFIDGAPAWTLDEASGQYYLHLFLPEQPDLNWGNPDVVAAMHDTLRFWLDRGVDGFRADVIHAIGKDPALPDNPADLAEIPHSGLNDDPRTHALLRDIRRLVDSYPGDRMVVGEVFLLSTAKVATYYGQGDELHLAFNFPPLFAPWDAAVWQKRIDRVDQELGSIDAWPSWVLSNHDVVRHRTRYGSEAKARAAAVLLLTLRGTPFLYQGEELGLEDAVVPPDRVVDPGGRDGCRAPIPWSTDPPHGWDGDEPWLPFAPQADQHSVQAQEDDQASVLHLYRRLLAARRSSPALTSGTQDAVRTPEGVLGFRRRHGADERVVLINFTSDPVDGVEPPEGPSTVVVASDGEGEGQPFTGRLGPDQAVLLG